MPPSSHNQDFYFNNASNDYLYVKGVVQSDEPTDNYYLTLQFPSALVSVQHLSAHCRFTAYNCTALGRLSPLSLAQHRFQQQQAAVFNKKKKKTLKAVCTLHAQFQLADRQS